MSIKAISHKLHPLYSYAIAQMDFDTKEAYKKAFKYMQNAYGTGIFHDPDKLIRGYNRNNGDNSVWYYADTRRRWAQYRLYLTTPEQITMVSLITGQS